MAAAARDPAELDFVLTPDTSGIEVRRRAEYDLYTRPLAGARIPLVVFVHGPVRGAGVRPRDWPVYRGYGSLAANAGIAGAVVDLDYIHVEALDAPIAQLGELLGVARAESAVDPEHVAIWAFSGGGRLVGHWLEDPPRWLKGIALTYPVVPTLTRVRTRVVVTRVGLENPTIQATVDQLLAFAPEAEVINVNGGQHGFDVLDHTDGSRRAVNSALDAVVRLLRSHSEE
jgi:dienelactone hydrolase